MNELDSVKLIKKFKGLKIGTDGVIVAKYNNFNFLVEIFDKKYNTIGVFFMTKDYLIEEEKYENYMKTHKNIKTKKEKDLKKLLNLSFLDLTNKTRLIGDLDMPRIACAGPIDIGYIALYSDRYDYHRDDCLACVSFYEYDNKFDNPKGLFNAIYYNDVDQLFKYELRLETQVMISPDYTLAGDIPLIENLYRLYKSRIVSLWLEEGIQQDIVVIPNISYTDESFFPYMIMGIEETEVIAISTKGSLKSKVQKDLLIKAIKYCVDNLKELKQIIVYSVSTNDKYVLSLFDYAIKNKIIVTIPNNKLKERNKLLLEKKNKK